MVRNIMLLVSLTGIAAANGLLAFVGTGNCDGEDHSCVEGPAAPEQIIRPLIIETNGSMSVPGNEYLSIPTGGAPVWLTTVGTDLQDGCIFATLANDSTIFSYGLKGSHTVPSGGVNPVFASVANNGHTLLVANYHGPDDSTSSDGASVASFEIGRGCSLRLVDVKNHSGSSINPKRQGGAHVHSVVSVRGGLAYACDLGMDKIFTYAVASNGKLTELHRTTVKAGSGPRHLVQHPSLPFVYVVSEMGKSVTAYKQGSKGTLELLQTETVVHSKLGNGTGSKAAEIAISPDGSLVFATNRGSQNTVTVFKTQYDGKLLLKGYVEAPVYPRGMALVADGTILIVGGQSKTEVWSYRVSEDGKLQRVCDLQSTGGKVDIPPHPSTFTTFEKYSPENIIL